MFTDVKVAELPLAGSAGIRTMLGAASRPVGAAATEIRVDVSPWGCHWPSLYFMLPSRGK
jgi:hypothetical protein